MNESNINVIKSMLCCSHNLLQFLLLGCRVAAFTLEEIQQAVFNKGEII